jgi:hypothetical protein
MKLHANARLSLKGRCWTAPPPHNDTPAVDHRRQHPSPALALRPRLDRGIALQEALAALPKTPIEPS